MAIITALQYKILIYSNKKVPERTFAVFPTRRVADRIPLKSADVGLLHARTGGKCMPRYSLLGELTTRRLRTGKTGLIKCMILNGRLLYIIWILVCTLTGHKPGNMFIFAIQAAPCNNAFCFSYKSWPPIALSATDCIPWFYWLLSLSSKNRGS